MEGLSRLTLRHRGRPTREIAERDGHEFVDQTGKRWLDLSGSNLVQTIGLLRGFKPESTDLWFLTSYGAVTAETRAVEERVLGLLGPAFSQLLWAASGSGTRFLMGVPDAGLGGAACGKGPTVRDFGLASRFS